MSLTNGDFELEFWAAVFRSDFRRKCWNANWDHSAYLLKVLGLSHLVPRRRSECKFRWKVKKKKKKERIKQRASTVTIGCLRLELRHCNCDECWHCSFERWWWIIRPNEACEVFKPRRRSDNVWMIEPNNCRWTVNHCSSTDVLRCFTRLYQQVNGAFCVGSGLSSKQFAP